MMRSDSISKQSSSSDSDGAEIVYSKDNVTIHPTQFASERIGGRLKLIKQGSSLFMVISVSISVAFSSIPSSFIDFGASFYFYFYFLLRVICSLGFRTKAKAPMRGSLRKVFSFRFVI